MAEAVAAKWVAVRLAQRYPNGSMVSYSGRAIAHDEISVCVLVSEEFESGTRLSIMAPFLGGLKSARVFSVTRSLTYPGFFEVFLQIGESTTPALTPRSRKQNHGLGKPKKVSDDESENRIHIADRPNAPSLTTEVPESAVEAARYLANGLGRLPSWRLSEVQNEMPAELRSMSLLVAVAAATHLLQQKGHVEGRRLMSAIKGTAAQTAKGGVSP